MKVRGVVVVGGEGRGRGGASDEREEGLIEEEGVTNGTCILVSVVVTTATGGKLDWEGVKFMDMAWGRVWLVRGGRGRERR